MSLNRGKFVIYFPRFSGRNERLKTVARAVVRLAKIGGANVEVSQRRDVLSVWVYYKNSRKEDLIYSDWGKNWSEGDVFQTISYMFYWLSLRPKQSVSIRH